MKIRHGSRKKHDSKLRMKFGIGLRQYEALFEEQRGLCFICNQPEKLGKNLAVDHCHKTGKVRRLLCHHCNTGIGHFNDDVELLNKAAEYLQMEFTMPVDAVEPTVRRKRRSIVKSPSGYFASLKEAANHYNVDTTTMAVWCGRQYTSGGKPKEGFEIKTVVGYVSTIEKITNRLSIGDLNWNEIEGSEGCLD